MIAANHSYIQSQLNLELSKRLRNQKGVVREIADQAEDVVWKRIHRYTILFGILLTFIAGTITFFGITTIKDVSRHIVDETASKVDLVKKSLNQLSTDIDAQRKRLTEKDSEISHKFADLDDIATNAEKRGKTLQAHSEELSAHLDALEKALQIKVDQISKQVDDVSIRRAYPGLGEKLFVTFNGDRWKGKSEKGLNVKWVNIWVTPLALRDFSPSQVEKLVAELKARNYTPLLGMFGVGGPYSSGLGPFGSVNETAVVYYFNKDSEQMGAVVCAIASKTLSVNDCKPSFLDPTTIPKDSMKRIILEQSGLDCQLALSPRSK